MRAVVNCNEYLTFNTVLWSHKKAPTNSEPSINPAAEMQSIHTTREREKTTLETIQNKFVYIW